MVNFASLSANVLARRNDSTDANGNYRGELMRAQFVIEVSSKFLSNLAQALHLDCFDDLDHWNILVFTQDGLAGLGMYLSIGGPGVGGGVEEHIGEVLASFRLLFSFPG
jgi:hypothetical protein